MYMYMVSMYIPTFQANTYVDWTTQHCFLFGFVFEVQDPNASQRLFFSA